MQFVGHFVLRHLVYAPLAFVWWLVYSRLTSSGWPTFSEIAQFFPLFVVVWLVLTTIFALVRLVGQKLRGGPPAPSRPA